MATATDDNAADEKSDKSIWQLLNIRCTSFAYKKVSRETFLANSNSYDTLYKLSVFSFSISCFSYIFSTYLLVKARITAK